MVFESSNVIVVFFKFTYPDFEFKVDFLLFRYEYFRLGVFFMSYEHRWRYRKYGVEILYNFFVPLIRLRRFLLISELDGLGREKGGLVSFSLIKTSNLNEFRERENHRRNWTWNSTRKKLIKNNNLKFKLCSNMNPMNVMTDVRK